MLLATSKFRTKEYPFCEKPQLSAIELKKINKAQISIGVAGLIVGSLVYLIDRPPDQTYFVYRSKIDISLFNTIPNLFGVIGSGLADFLHVFSFILITGALFSCKRTDYLIICLSWFSLDAAFELCQRFNTLPLKIIPDWFEGVPFLENTKGYFQKGTFDVFDLVAIAFGTAVAYFVLYRDLEIIRTQLLQFEQGQHTLVNFYESKTAWGYKPILGAIWEPFDKLAVGLSASKIYVASSDHEQQMIFRDTSGTYSFPDDTNAIYFTRLSDTDKDKFPLATSLGLAYFASPGLLFSADITHYEEVSDKESVYNFSLGTEYYLTDSLALRAGFFTDSANTPSLSPTGTNQREHIDIYGISLSLTAFHKKSSTTLGISYGLGKGEAQVVADSTAVQDAEIENLAV